MCECTGEGKDLNAEEHDESLALRRLDSGICKRSKSRQVGAEHIVPKNWIVITSINQNAEQNLVGHFYYDIGENESDPRVHFGRTLADLLSLLSFTTI